MPRGYTANWTNPKNLASSYSFFPPQSDIRPSLENTPEYPGIYPVQKDGRTVPAYFDGVNWFMINMTPME